MSPFMLLGIFVMAILAVPIIAGIIVGRYLRRTAPDLAEAPAGWGPLHALAEGVQPAAPGPWAVPMELRQVYADDQQGDLAVRLLDPERTWEVKLSEARPELLILTDGERSFYSRQRKFKARLRTAMRRLRAPSTGGSGGASLRPALAVLVLLLCALPACASCQAESPWVRAARELRALQKQALDALQLATDPRTRAALQLCNDSALLGIQRADELHAAVEKVRIAKRQGLVIPEHARAAAVAATEAEDAEAQARLDCKRAGVTLRGGRPGIVSSGPLVIVPAADGGAPPAADLPPPAGAAVDGGRG